MSLHELSTIVDGHKYIIENSTLDYRIESSVRALIDIRNQLIERNNDRYDALIRDIDDIALQKIAEDMNRSAPTPSNSLYVSDSEDEEESAAEESVDNKLAIYRAANVTVMGIDDRIDNAVNALLTNNKTVVITGAVLLASYLYMYYLWFTSTKLE